MSYSEPRDLPPHVSKHRAATTSAVTPQSTVRHGVEILPHTQESVLHILDEILRLDVSNQSSDIRDIADKLRASPDAWSTGVIEDIEKSDWKQTFNWSTGSGPRLFFQQPVAFSNTIFNAQSDDIYNEEKCMQGLYFVTGKADLASEEEKKGSSPEEGENKFAMRINIVAQTVAQDDMPRETDFSANVISAIIGTKDHPIKGVSEYSDDRMISVHLLPDDATNLHQILSHPRFPCTTCEFMPRSKDLGTGVVMSRTGSITPGHLDCLGEGALVMQVSGKKIWFWWPPNEANIKAFRGAAWGDAPVPLVFLFTTLTGLIIIITQPGDALFHPAAWLHAVISLADGIDMMATHLFTDFVNETMFVQDCTSVVKAVIARLETGQSAGSRMFDVIKEWFLLRHELNLTVLMDDQKERRRQADEERRRQADEEQKRGRKAAKSKRRAPKSTDAEVKHTTLPSDEKELVDLVIEALCHKKIDAL